jgi:hypothetical protein
VFAREVTGTSARTTQDFQSPLGVFVAEGLSEVFFFAGEVSLVSDLSPLVVLAESLFSSERFSFLPLPA